MPRPGRRLIIRSITRSKADDGLGSSEKRYRELVENSNELIWSADAFGRWTFVNAAARRIYGCAPEEMIGRPMTDWMVPGEARKDLKTLERILEGERYVQYETRHRRKDGKLVTLSFKTAAVRDAQGNLLGTTGIASDITGQREVEEARRVSEARFRNLFERNLAGVYRTALDGRIIDCNESFARMLGYASREEVRGRNGRDFYPEPGDRDAFLARLREEGSLTNSEVRLRRKDGGAVWVLENVHLIEEGSPPETVIEGTMVDVTERRRAVDALRESEEYFRSLIDNALDVIMIVDAGGAIRYGSPSLERLLGYKPQEVLEDAVFDYVHPEDGEAVRRMFTGLVHGSGSASAEFRVRHRDGSWRHMEAIGSDLSNHPSVAGLLVQLRDVTERKAADENQARLQFAIQDAAKEWQRTFDAIESPVLILDGNALIRRLNRAAKVLSGKTYRETIGVSIESLGPGEPWQKSAELAREIRTGRIGDVRPGPRRRDRPHVGRGGQPPARREQRVRAHHPRRPRDHGRRAAAGEAPPHAHDVGDGLARRRRRPRGPQPALRDLGHPRRVRGAVRVPATSTRSTSRSCAASSSGCPTSWAICSSTASRRASSSARAPSATSSWKRCRGARRWPTARASGSSTPRPRTCRACGWTAAA